MMDILRQSHSCWQSELATAISACQVSGFHGLQLVASIPPSIACSWRQARILTAACWYQMLVDRRVHVRMNMHLSIDRQAQQILLDRRVQVRMKTHLCIGRQAQQILLAVTRVRMASTGINGPQLQLRIHKHSTSCVVTPPACPVSYFEGCCSPVQPVIAVGLQALYAYGPRLEAGTCVVPACAAQCFAVLSMLAGNISQLSKRILYQLVQQLIRTLMYRWMELVMAGIHEGVDAGSSDQLLGG